MQSHRFRFAIERIDYSIERSSSFFSPNASVAVRQTGPIKVKESTARSPQNSISAVVAEAWTQAPDLSLMESAAAARSQLSELRSAS